MEQIVDYSRQADMDGEIGTMFEYTHVIVGCGGIGFWLGILLSMIGIENLVLIDGDKLDPSNLNRIPVAQTWVGTNKAIALRKTIRQMRPLTSVMVLTKHATMASMDTLLPLANQRRLYIWDCTDNARFQVQLFGWARNNHQPYRKIGYEGYQVGAYKDYNIWIDDNYQTGYRTSRANAISSVMAAGWGALFSFFSNQPEKTIDFKQEVRREPSREPEAEPTQGRAETRESLHRRRERERFAPPTSTDIGGGTISTSPF